MSAKQAAERRRKTAGGFSNDPSQVASIVIYDSAVSLTIFRAGGYRFYFFSREELRMHVHVHHQTGEAKFWLEPQIAVAENYGLSPARLNAALRLVEEHENEIRAAWQTHFGRRSN